MPEPIEELVFVPMSDGVRLSAKLYRPASADAGEPVPCIVEALPYRKDDVTLGYESEYRRLRDEGGYGVCRVDVRGTGSSEGIPDDEYTERELQDWEELMAWLVDQPWCTGSLGMWGTSYSGFNALQTAMRRPPGLKAIISIFATDSRFTDDVHFGGGAQRGIDLADYPLYMAGMNALPPAPHVYGEGWRDQWNLRIDNVKPWLMRWLEEQTESDYWLHGSLKTDYESIQAATMIIAGWADGYHNMGFRSLENMTAPTHLLAGPWAHMSLESSTPGPHIDVVPEMIAWWDLWLKEDKSSPAASWPQVRAYMRRPTVPAPDLWIHEGEWWGESTWPVPRATTATLPLGDGTDDYEIRGYVGFYGSIWCAGALPWGPPMDQREDDALSLTYEWPVEEETAILGHPHFRVRVKADVPVTYLSAKLNSVFPDGTSAMVSRGILNLTHRDSSADPKPLIAGEYYDIDLELDATAWIFEPGHTIRLSVSTSDWPSSWAPPLPGTITIDREGSSLELPVIPGGRVGDEPTFHPPAGKSARAEAEQTPHEVVWKIEHDVLARERAIVVDYGYAVDDDEPIKISDHQHTRLSVSTTDPGASVFEGTSMYRLRWPEVDVVANSSLRVQSDATSYIVTLSVTMTGDGEEVMNRTWERTIPRNLQ